MVDTLLMITLAACEPPVDTCPWQDTNQTQQHNQTRPQARPPGDFVSFHDYMRWHSKPRHMQFDQNATHTSRTR